MWLDSATILSNLKKRLSIKHERYTNISSDLTTFPEDFALDIWHLSNKTFIFKFKDYIYGILIKDWRYKGEAEVYYAWNPTKNVGVSGYKENIINKDFKFNFYYDNHTKATSTQGIAYLCANQVLPNAYFRYDYKDDADINFVPPFLISLGGQHTLVTNGIWQNNNVTIYCHTGNTYIKYGNAGIFLDSDRKYLYNAKFCFFLPVAPYKPNGKIEIYTIR